MSFCYNKVSERFWTDEKVMDWADSTKLLALYLLTCPHRTSEGLFRLPQKYIMADLAWDAQTFDRAFSRLSRDGFLEYDPKAQVILLPNALKYCEFRNENQVKGAVNKLRELPKTDLLFRFLEVCESSDSPYLKQIGFCFETEWDLFRNKTEFVSNTLTQTQSPTQYQTPSPTEKSSVSKPDKKIRAPRVKEEITDPDFLEVFALWQRKKGGQPRTAGYNRWKALLEAGYSGKDLLSAGREYFAQKDKQAEREHKLTDHKFIQAFETFYGPNLRFEGYLPSEMAALKKNTAMDDYLKDKGVMKEDGTIVEVEPDELTDDDLPDWCKDKVPDVRRGSGDGIERDKLPSPLPVPSGGN